MPESRYLNAIEDVIKGIAPDKQVEVTESIGPGFACLVLKPSASSHGMIIGKKGATFKAIRGLYQVIAANVHELGPDVVTVNVIQPDSSERHRHGFTPDPEFTEKRIVSAVGEFSKWLFPFCPSVKASPISPEMAHVIIEGRPKDNIDPGQLAQDLKRVFEAFGMSMGRKIMLTFSPK